MIDSVFALVDNIKRTVKTLFKKEENPEDYRPLQKYSERLDYHLYEVLSDVSDYNGTGGNVKGMAVTALLTATDLYAKCGIEGDDFIKECAAAIKAVAKYNTTKDPDSDKPIDIAAEKHYKTV